MTVLEVIQRSASFLARKGVESPRLQVELLLEHVLGMPRLELYLNFERVLNDSEKSRLREFVRRRGLREPLQHIIGSTSFCGFDLKVSRDVLIPRPETELLAERAWKFLNQLAEMNPELRPVAVDFGTGSGCLAVAIARQSPRARVHAVEVSAAAVAVARENAATHQVLDRIEFHTGADLAAVTETAGCDLLVSNPPYIPTEQIARLDPEVRDFDPRLALDGGVDGLRIYRLLARDGTRIMRPGGRMMLEIGEDQSTAVSDLLTGHNWVVEAVERDYTGRPRLVVALPA